MSTLGSSTLPSHKRRAKTPSFSSILLDSIYRSFDTSTTPDPHPHPHPHPCHTSPYPTDEPYNNYRNIHNHIDKNNSAKQRRSKMRSDSTLALDSVDLRRATMIDTWIDKHQSQPYDHHQKIRFVRQKSVPTNSSPPSEHHRANQPSKRVVSSSRVFTKTKSRALKLYGDLRKPKQQPPSSRSPPVSPGGRIAAFLNSIFRHPVGAPARGSNPASTSTCSSASSFSRSCLSKTPSSRGKSSSSSTETKRSVRFYPISVIVDEDSRPCGHKSLHKEDENEKVISNQRKLRREKEIDTLMMMIKRDCRDRRICQRFDCGGDYDEEMNENDDGESCASSDLFELENLSSIGVSRYTEELPVYGTTSLQNLTAS